MWLADSTRQPYVHCALHVPGPDLAIFKVICVSPNYMGLPVLSNLPHQPNNIIGKLQFKLKLKPNLISLAKIKVSCTLNIFCHNHLVTASMGPGLHFSKVNIFLSSFS